MSIDWDLTAQTFFDQLPAQKRAKLTGSLGDLYSRRAGGQLRALVRKHDDGITVVDVVRRSQVERLRRLWQGQGAAE